MNEMAVIQARTILTGFQTKFKSIQNLNVIILNVSPTCLNRQKMEALLTVIWRYMQSTLKI